MMLPLVPRDRSAFESHGARSGRDFRGGATRASVEIKIQSALTRLACATRIHLLPLTFKDRLEKSGRFGSVPSAMTLLLRLLRQRDLPRETRHDEQDKPDRHYSPSGRAEAGREAPEIATITGHSLRDVEAILDAHYLGMTTKLGASRGRQAGARRGGDGNRWRTKLQNNQTVPDAAWDK
jgi:hypothetical protein